MTEKQQSASKNRGRLTTIILAAGKGTRMKSPLPKVLHPVAGKSMLQRVVERVQQVGCDEVRVVVGYGENLVRQVIEPTGAVCFKQVQQNGTGDAVKAAQPETIEGTVLILNGDHPLIQEEDLQSIMDDFHNSSDIMSVVTCRLKKPGSFGRIVRDSSGRFHGIVEAKDASHETLKVREVNTGIYLMRAEALNRYLPQVTNSNAQGEYYLTDVIGLAREAGEPVGTILAKPRVAFGVNDQSQLARASQVLFRMKAKKLMDDGVVILDPAHVYIEDSVQVGEASVIYPGTFIRGATVIGRYCVIEPNCMLTNVTLEDSVQVRAMTHLEDCILRQQAGVGPYARLRPGTEIGEEAHVGNFVEMKKTKFGKGAKAGHLSYLGDAEIGKDVNIGCGTITCNYAVDRKKYKTIIGEGTFVGSDTQFVAPIEIGKDAVIASGSTITKNVPDNALAVARGRQIVKENYTKSTSSASTEKTQEK